MAAGAFETPGGREQATRRREAEDAQLARRAVVLARWAKAQNDTALAGLYGQVAAAHVDRHLAICPVCAHRHEPGSTCCNLCHRTTRRPMLP